MNPRRTRYYNLSTARVLTLVGAGFAFYGYMSHNPNEVYCDSLTQDVEKNNCSIPSNITCSNDRNEYVDTVNITCGHGPIDRANEKSAKVETAFTIAEVVAIGVSIFSLFYAEKERISRNIQQYMRNSRALLAPAPINEGDALIDIQRHEDNVLTPLAPH